MNDQAFADLKAKSLAAGKADKADGLMLVPFSSTRFQDLIQNLSYKQKQAMVSEYATGYRGYRLDVSKLPGLFNDRNQGENHG